MMSRIFPKSGPAGPERVEAELQRSRHVALFLSISILGLAGLYFGSLYLITHL
jgi:hypothetical protein